MFLWYALSKLIYQVVYQGKLINTLRLCHKYGYTPCKLYSLLRLMFFCPYTCVFLLIKM